MGIPKFFRWAGDRFPAILSKPIGEDEKCPPVDNLYLDMNGIIHNCSHGNDNVLYGAMDVAQIAEKVCVEVNRLVSEIAHPQRLLYIAIDGVAPRAKLNQQRARRFRAAKELQKKIEDEAAADGNASDGRRADGNTDGTDISSYFDSNCITPGTVFMEQISIHIKAYIHSQMAASAHWRHLQVIFSGSDVPGEGEHKLIAFIRTQRANGTMPADTRHCIYGADADMMMLGIATHEAHVIILRECVTFSRNKGPAQPLPAGDVPQHAPKPMQYLRVHALREYLLAELGDLEGGSRADGERVLDDFVFLSFFVGNDFLPHLPGLSIGDDAFDLIFDAYRSIEGYLIADGHVDYAQLELIVSMLGAAEEVVYAEQETNKAMREMHRAQQHRRSRDGRESRDGSHAHTPADSEGHTPMSPSPNRSADHSPTRGPHPPSSNSSSAPSPMPVLPMHGIDVRQSFYLTKHHIDLHRDPEALQTLVMQYLKGLSWCHAYYTQGCIDWDYFYPYHYGIFLADLTNLTQISRRPDFGFNLSSPLTPFEQLLACLPPQSSTLLPVPYRALMLPSSTVGDFYPTEFETDLNGMKMEYEAVVLLPFIDVHRLLQAEADLHAVLHPAEQARNGTGLVHTYSFKESLQEVTASQSILPGQRFQPVLSSTKEITGYPSLEKLLEHHSFGKTRYTPAQLKKGKGGGRGRAGAPPQYPHRGVSAGEAFPMPGTAALPHLTGVQSIWSAPVTTAVPADTVHSELRLLVDDGTDQFLSALSASIQQAVPAFSSHLEDAYLSLPCAADARVVQKVCTIFGPLHGHLTAHVVSMGNGLVGVTVRDTSHLDQIDAYVTQKLYKGMVM